MADRLPRLVDAAAVALVAAGLVLGLLIAPPDALQGNLQRLMYVHVPAAWTAYLAFFATLVSSVAWLRTRRDCWDRRAVAFVEVGLFFTGLTLVLGSIWGKPVWGVWWTWDPRLVTTALLFVVYLGYLSLRRATEDPVARSRRAAIFGIVAFVQVPIVHMSVVWWRTLHQPASVLRPGDTSIARSMLVALLVNVAAFTAVFAALVYRRTALARARARRAPDDVSGLAEDAVTAPALPPRTTVGDFHA